MRKWNIPARGPGSPPQVTPRQWFGQQLLVVCIDYGPEVMQLGHRVAPHLRTMAEAREAAGIVVEASDGP